MTNSSDNRPNYEPNSDLVQRPVSALLWWCLPLCVGFSANLITLLPRATALVWVIAFTWMGIGCVVNARRCHRLHCYISGPAFLLGAATIGLLGLGAFAWRPHALNNVVGITLVAALLSFVPEVIWRKYA